MEGRAPCLTTPSSSSPSDSTASSSTSDSAASFDYEYTARLLQDQLLSPSAFDAPCASERSMTGNPQPCGERNDSSASPTEYAFLKPVGADYPECMRMYLPPITCWEDLKCIRCLNRCHLNGIVDDRGYEILYRMCCMIWSIGHEVEIRKKVKVPRAERLARFQGWLEAVLQGAKIFQKNMKSKMLGMYDMVKDDLPKLGGVYAYQDLEPLLPVWYRALNAAYMPKDDDRELFEALLEHFHDSYIVLYCLHREKPDYGLSGEIFDLADRVYHVLVKLPNYAADCDSNVKEFEDHFWEKVRQYREDRRRQETQRLRFDGMPRKHKQRYFKRFIEVWHPEFADQVNESADASTLSQAEFDSHLQFFHAEFLDCTAGMIKADVLPDFGGGPNADEIMWRLQEVGDQRDAQEAIRGWEEALGLRSEPRPDDQKSDRTVIESSTDDSISRTSAECSRAEKLDVRSTSGVEQSRGGADLLQGELDKHRGHRDALHAENVESTTTSVQHDHGHQMLEHRAEDTSTSTQISHVRQLDTLTTPDTRALRKRDAGAPLHISKSFAIVEDDIAERGHHRAVTVADPSYTMDDSGPSDFPRPAASFHGRGTGTRRHGVQVPRIFTGSFSQLETDIRRMQLHKVNTPEDQPDLSQEPDLTVRDFAVTPSPSPSPVTLLFRREALLSRETEIQDRVINGEVIKTRRPSTKGRAQTVDETTGGLELWLAQDPARSDPPTIPLPPLPRPERQNTM